MSIKSYNVDGNIAEAFQKKYPNKASKLINEFMKSMLFGEMDDKFAEEKQIEEELSEIEQNLTDSTAKKQLLILKLEEMKKQDSIHWKNKISELKEEFMSLPVVERMKISDLCERGIIKQLIPPKTTPIEFYGNHFQDETLVEEIVSHDPEFWKKKLEYKGELQQ